MSQKVTIELSNSSKHKLSDDTCCMSQLTEKKSAEILPLFQVIRCFGFGQSQTASSLTKFIDKYSNNIYITKLFLLN